MAIEWYQCTDGNTPDCSGDIDTMVADERDGHPAFSVWFEKYFKDFKWRWAAWAPIGGDEQALASGTHFDTQAAAMQAAETWLATYAATSAPGDGTNTHNRKVQLPISNHDFRGRQS